MRRKITAAACAFAAAVALAASAKTVDFPIPDVVRSWDIPERATNGVKAVWIENVPWHGKPTRFFAYYSLPEGATAEKKVPGIVLVHGGYGTAFHTWVKLWNDRGYAAIAMDNCGGIPGEKNHTAEHPRHEWSGPNGWGRYEEEALPPEEQWVYHAIECVIRSHTFLRNLPEVDASKIGVTGISWGGFLTSIVCGADPRFAFAAPVYGCGNLRRHSVFAPEIGELWETLWNPVEYAKNCRIPTLWCTGTNDYFFPLDSFEETAFAAGNPLFSIKLRMKHGHPPEGDPPEIAAFADSIVKGAPKLTARKVARREWLYTSSANPVWKDRPFEVANEEPQNWTIRFENLITDDGLILSSPPEFRSVAARGFKEVRQCRELSDPVVLASAVTLAANEIAEKFPVAENMRGHENTEWSISYAYHLIDEKKNLPRVLLVGDSICQGYQGKVAAKLEGRANVTYWASSYCVTSPGYLRLLAFYLDEAKYDVIHFNNGLHSCETPDADYEKAYRNALRLIREKQPGAKLLWATSTPLNTDNAKRAGKVVELNAAAKRAVCDIDSIGVNDLFSLLNPLDRKAYWVDMHHYTNAGYELIASQIVEKVSAAVTGGKRSHASIEEARMAARKMPKPAVVHLPAGTYRLEKPLVLTPEDSGVTYVADGDVVISGARPVTGWRVEKDGTWSAPVPWVKPDRTGGFRSLRINGTMRPRARLPKSGFFKIVNDDLPVGTAYNVPRPSFFYDPTEFNPEWKNLKDAEIVCFHFWVDTHLRIASVDAVSNKVTFVTSAGKAFDTGWSNNKSGGNRGIYTIENLPAAMTEPGEWWLEYGARRVHYRPMPGERPETVKAEVPFCPVLVALNGAPEKGGRYVENVAFRGIRFELSQFELPANDVNDRQAAASVSAAVRLAGARNCRFEDCTFADLGGYAVDILKGSRNNVFSRCTMTRLGAGGVRLDGGVAGCSSVELTSGNVVEDCEIGPYGLDFRSGVGVLLKNAERTRIVHNHIHDGYYTGVSAGWVWGYYPSVSRDNEISHNHIHDIGKGLLSDMGGIYTLGPSSGTRIVNNRIHGVDARNYGGWGIYQDEGSTGILVENNVVYDTKFAPYDIHYAKDITVRNNIFAFGKKDQVTRAVQEPHISCELKNNIFYWTEGNLYSGNWKDAETPYAVHRQGNSKKANEKGAVVTFEADRNVYFNPLLAANQVKFGNGMRFDAWRKMGKDVHSVYADPLFTDAARRDFRLMPESPAFKMGFVYFNQSDIGPRRSR